MIKVRLAGKMLAITSVLVVIYYGCVRAVAYLVAIQVWGQRHAADLAARSYTKSFDDKAAMTQLLSGPSFWEGDAPFGAWTWGVLLAAATLACLIIIGFTIALCFRRSREKVTRFVKRVIQAALKEGLERLAKSLRGGHAVIAHDPLSSGAHMIDFCAGNEPCNHGMKGWDPVRSRQPTTVPQFS